MTSKTGFLLAVLALAVTFSAIAAVKAQTPDKSTAAAGQKTTEQVYKNIKALKGVPADQLIPAMQFITASLGVKCDHCHAEGHFDSDEKKPKETARKMMAMMFAINKDNFAGERKVTCYSCHRGALKPLQTPGVGEQAAVPMMAMAESAEAPRPDLNLLPPATELIDNYVKASGGADSIGKVSSRTETGTTTGMGGHTFQFEAFYKSPDQSSTLTHFPNGTITSTLNGGHAWMIFPGRPARDLEGADLEAARMDSNLHFAVDLKTMFSSFKPAPSEKIDGRDAFRVLGLNSGQPPIELFFDQQSGELVRLIRYAESPLGLYPTQIDYADYRDVQGVKVPFRVTTSRPGSSSTFQADKVEDNVGIPESRFAAPPEAVPAKP